MLITRLFTVLSLVSMLALASSCSQEEAAPAEKKAPAKRAAKKTAKKTGTTAAAATAKPTAAKGGAWVGISHQPADEEAAKDAGLKKTTGVLVTDVTDGGPGSNAGVRSGDVIVAANGRAIKDSVAFLAYVKTVKPGATIQMELWRDGVKKVLPVITKPRP